MQDAVSAKLGVVRNLTAAERLDSVYVVLATLAVALTALPFSKLVLGDDSSYAMTARTFATAGHLAYNGWAAPSLGWQVLWGALFLKLFGDSGPSLIVSMIMVGLVAIFLWHRVLLHFGISRRNAAIVALAFAVSPLYLTLVDSFMTDIPGFLSLALCVTLCQRAVLARTNRATVLWLLSACAVNLVDGSVRQICWLGALVMVPSTAWLLRRRRGALWAGAASIVVAPAVIAAYLHWYLAHAYVIPERYLAAPLTLGVLLHGVSEWSLAFLLLTVVIAPVTIAWVLQMGLLSFAAKVRVGLAMALAALYLLSRMHPAALQAKLVFPWLESIYEGIGFPYGKAVLKTPAPPKCLTDCMTSSNCSQNIRRWAPFVLISPATLSDSSAKALTGSSTNRATRFSFIESIRQRRTYRISGYDSWYLIVPCPSPHLQTTPLPTTRILFGMIILLIILILLFGGGGFAMGPGFGYYGGGGIDLILILLLLYFVFGRGRRL